MGLERYVLLRVYKVRTGEVSRVGEWRDSEKYNKARLVGDTLEKTWEKCLTLINKFHKITFALLG